MSTKKKSILGVILYNSKNSPKYYEIKERILKLILIFPPIIAIISFIIVIFMAYNFKKIRTMAALKEPKIIKELKDKNQKLTLERDLLKNSNKLLNEKLATPISGENSFSEFSLFFPVPGQQNLTDKKFLSIDNLSITKRNKDEIKVNFNLVNNESEFGKRKAGHIFIFHHEGNKMQIYPKNAKVENELSLRFNKGEYFATSRFRPVTVSFKSTNPKSNFLVVVFSRTGDIIHKEVLKQ